MTEIDVKKCKSCGATVKPNRDSCDYCGSLFVEKTSDLPSFTANYTADCAEITKVIVGRMF